MTLILMLLTALLLSSDCSIASLLLSDCSLKDEDWLLLNTWTDGQTDNSTARAPVGAKKLLREQSIYCVSQWPALVISIKIFTEQRYLLWGNSETPILILCLFPAIYLKKFNQKLKPVEIRLDRHPLIVHNHYVDKCKRIINISANIGIFFIFIL